MDQVIDHKKIIRYVISGGSATVANLLGFYLLSHVLHYLLASAFALLISTSVSFTLQKFWTFQDNSREKMVQQFSMYMVVILGGLVFNTFLMWLLVDGFGVWKLLAQFITNGAMAVGNFFLYRELVFKKSTPLS